MKRMLTSEEAASLLGVSRQSLYSYVSRGLLRAQENPDGRGKRYDRHEVERLKQLARSGRKRQEAARSSLSFGLPVLESRLTLIHKGQLWYRGQSAIRLADDASLEDIARLLWDCKDDPFARKDTLPAEAPSPARHLALLEQAMLRFTQLADTQPLPADEFAQCALLTRLMAAALLGAPASREPLHEQCAQAWQVDTVAASRVRSALILCADHELNVSSFSARCVASSGASLVACVTGALAALSGPRHGLATERVEALLDRTDDLDNWIAKQAEAGLAVPGFGHVLYPHGDPRAQRLLEALPLSAAQQRIVDSVTHHHGLRPNLDFALVALRRALGLPRGAAASIFCLGRVVGWLAHALEQRRYGDLIRPRAQYVGNMPSTPRTPASSARIIRNGKPAR